MITRYDRVARVSLSSPYVPIGIGMCRVLLLLA